MSPRKRFTGDWNSVHANQHPLPAFCRQTQTPAILRAAHKLLTIPDLFHYWLTGKAVCEFTNATTTQLVIRQPHLGTNLIERLELPSQLPRKLSSQERWSGRYPGDLQLAFARANASDRSGHTRYRFGRGGDFCTGRNRISEFGNVVSARDRNRRPVSSPEALRPNFTNEGGVYGTTRFLKNVMGLWMLQCCRRPGFARAKSMTTASDGIGGAGSTLRSPC